MAAAFEAIRHAILAAIHGAGDPDAAHQAALHAHDRQHAALAALIGDVLYTAASTGGLHLTSQVQEALPDLPDYDPDADLPDWISAQQTPIAAAVQDHTRSMLASALAAALIAASTSTTPLADAVNTLYDLWTGQSGDSDLAGTLAGDWTATGWNHGEWNAADQMSASGGTHVERTWNAMMDARTRPEHADADGQTVGLHEPFDVGGESLMYPGDPTGSPGNTINCRCIVSYAVSGNAVDVDMDEGA